jgi:hypothetical protein
MDGQDVGAAEQFVFRHVGRPGLFGGFGCQVRAPRDDVHAERLAHLGHSAADSSQSEHAQHGAAQLRADGGLPAAGAHRPGLVDDPTGGGKDQRPGELDRRLHVATGGADVDAAFLGGRDVDGRVERPGRGDHLQSRQALDDVTRQRCALPHDTHHVEPRQPLNDGVWVGEVIVEDGDLGPVGHL